MDHLFDVPRPREGARRRRTGRPYRRSRPWRLGGDGLGSPPLTGPLRGATLRASEEEASASDMALEVSAKGRGSVPSRKEFAPDAREKNAGHLELGTGRARYKNPGEVRKEPRQGWHRPTAHRRRRDAMYVQTSSQSRLFSSLFTGPGAPCPASEEVVQESRLDVVCTPST